MLCFAAPLIHLTLEQVYRLPFATGVHRGKWAMGPAGGTLLGICEFQRSVFGFASGQEWSPKEELPVLKMEVQLF